VLPKFDFDPYMIVSAHQLVSEAIIMDKPQTDDAPSEEVEENNIQPTTNIVTRGTRALARWCLAYISWTFMRFIVLKNLLVKTFGGKNIC
jgi:uncharacterized protein with ATP-grasp and redox domains